MTELEYINATNLAKLRIAKEILKDVMFMEPERSAILKDALAKVANLAFDLGEEVSSRKQE